MLISWIRIDIEQGAIDHLTFGLAIRLLEPATSGTITDTIANRIFLVLDDYVNDPAGTD